MKQLSIPFSSKIDRTTAIEIISEALDELDKNEINALPWPSYDYKPEVQFIVAHSNDCLFLKFYVKERAIRAVHRQTNDPVYKDSCVEFFVAFNGDEKYYNFEFNCAGTCHAGFGINRHGREYLTEAVIAKIKTLPVIKPANNKRGDISWQLTLQVPLEVFCKHELTQLTGLNAKMNFFKCGDDLPKPHFLSWNKIESEEPNFHLPEFFGPTEFV